MDEFWDGDTLSGSRTVDVYMTKLRSKFSDCTDKTMPPCFRTML